MTDKTERRIEMLQSHQKGKSLVDSMTTMVAVVTASGEEGIREIAQEDPDVILTAINSLMTMINTLQNSNDQLLEYWLSSMDSFDEFVEMIRSKS